MYVPCCGVLCLIVTFCFSVIRFEARHRLFRKHAAVQSNFKNVPKTMAKMAQLSTLGAVVTKTGPEENKVSSHGTVRCIVKDSPYCDDLLQQGLSENEVILIAKSAELCGEEYTAGLFVALKDETAIFPSIPVFALIIEALVKPSGQEIFLAVAECRCEGLNARYNAYKISNVFDGVPRLVTLKDLANYRAIAPWNPMGTQDSVSLFLSPRTLIL